MPSSTKKKISPTTPKTKNEPKPAAKPNKPHRKMFSLSGLCNRGWTPAMVRDYLGEPDQRGQNPHYRHAEKTRLYYETRVVKIEATDAFKKRLATAAARRIQGQKTATKRAEELVEWAKTTPIEWIDPPVNADAARKEGLKHWENRTGEYADNPDHETRNRWARNYVRHCCMEYEYTLDETSTIPGVREAYVIIRGRCDNMIDERYPGIA